MFTDEKLEEIYAGRESNPEWGHDIIQTLLKTVTKENVITDLKRANNAYKLFAQRHPEIDPRGFKLLLMKKCSPLADAINRIL